MLRGTLRDPTSGGRRAYVRFFACRRDLSHEGMMTGLPREVAEGEEVLIVLGGDVGGLTRSIQEGNSGSLMQYGP